MSILILHHRELLGKQLCGHVGSRGRSYAIEQGSHFAEMDVEVVIATVQTLNSGKPCKYRDELGEHPRNCKQCIRGKRYRMQRFPRDHFSTIIIDEGHHAAARTYRRVIDWFTDAKVLLVTATPQRGDGIGLHNVCDIVAHDKMQLQHSISEGWLVPIRQQIVEVTDLHLERVGTKKGGDFADGQLEQAMIGENGQVVHEVAASLVRIANRRKTIVFASGKQHAQELTEAINAEGQGQAECMIQDTPQNIRDGIVKRLKNGETTYLVNCMIATEGFDVPDVEVVANCRPTKSVTLLSQMIGRGTRPLTGLVDGIETADGRRQAIAMSAKPYCHVLDFVGSSRDVKIVTVADLLAGDDVDDADIAEAANLARDEAGPVDMEEMLAKAIQSRLRKEQEAEEARARAAAYKAQSVEYQTQDVSLFGGPSWKEKLAEYVPEWDGATEAQVRMLCNAGWKFESATSLTKKQASGAISKLVNQKPGPDYKMPFGKHAGKPIKSLPPGYLRWLDGADLKPALRESVDIVLGRVPVGSMEEAPF